MKNLLSSATKLVLVLFAVVLSLTVLLVVVSNRNDNAVVTGVLSLFSNAVIAVIAFYFGQKGMTLPPPANE